MKATNLKVTLLPHTPFLLEDGKFDLKRAMSYQGQIGGICYSEDGLMASFSENEEKTETRVNGTTSGEHQTVFEHVNVGLYLQGSPKFLNMILNNEHQYSTSERSLRYTTIKEWELPSAFIEFYNKWNDIFFTKIKSVYGGIKSDKQIMKLAMENSRYLMPVTIPTEMVHTLPLAQLNRVTNYLMDYRDNGVNSKKDNLHEQMVPYIDEFIGQLREVNVIDDRLLSNRKHRSLSIFGEDLKNTERYFGDVYSTVYESSFASLAQAQRHRTIYYQMERLNDDEISYFVPPIISDDPILTSMWFEDNQYLAKEFGSIPQSEKVIVSEKGTFDNFVMKMKERLCSAAQLEVAMQTEETRDEYYNYLVEQGNDKASKMEPYMNGARCTFPDYDCPKDCGFKEGKLLVRKI